MSEGIANEKMAEEEAQKIKTDNENIKTTSHLIKMKLRN